MKRIVFLVTLLLSLSLDCFAVTTFTVTVNKTGEDYSLISTAEDALDLAGSLTDGTVKCGSWDSCTLGSCTAADFTDGEAVTWDAALSSGTLIHLTGTQYCIDVAAGTLDDNDLVTDVGGLNIFQINGAGDSCIINIDLYDDEGALDDRFTIDGFTSNATNYVSVSSPVGERHNGTKSSGAKLANTSAGTAARTLDQGGIIEWLIITSNISSASNFSVCILGDGVSGNADDTIFRNNIVADCTNTGTGIVSRGLDVNGDASNDEMYIHNNIIEDVNESESGECIEIGSAGASDDYFVDNNTLRNCGALGIDVVDTTSNNVARNNMSFGHASGDYDTGFDTFTTNGASDTSGSPDALDSLDENSQFTNLTAGSENFHLIAGSAAIDAGTDLVTTKGVNFDIDNYDRDAGGVTWDLGADEFTLSGRRIFFID